MNTENKRECDECGLDLEKYPLCPYCIDDTYREYIGDHCEFIRRLGSINKALAWKSLTGQDILTCVAGDCPRELRFWLDVGADPNSTDYDGNTALYIALIHENYKAFRTLIKHGADCSPFVDVDLMPFTFQAYSEKKTKKEHKKARKCIVRYTARDMGGGEY